MVFAHERVDGTLRWAWCSAEDVVPNVVGATEQLVYALVTKDNRSDDTKSVGRLVALDADTGAERWSLDVGPRPMMAAGALDGGGVLVVLAQGDSALLGVDAIDGSVRWRLDGRYQWPAIANEPVVIVSDVSVVPQGGGPVTLGPDGSPPPLMMGQGYSGFDRTSGTKLWSTMVMAPQELDGGGFPFGAIDGDVAVVGPGAAGIDAMTGAALWSADEAPAGAATGYGGSVVFAGQEGPVTAVNISSGDVLWTAPGKAPYDDQVAVGDAAVYVLDGTDIVAYELKSGTVRWRQPQDPTQLTQPWRAVEGEVFTMWWNLEARAADTGAVRWATGYPTKTDPVDGPRMTSIAANSTIVAVGFVSGSLGGD